jgi:hypothetical protein
MNILLSFTDNKYSEMNNNNFYNIIFKSHDKELYIKLLLFDLGYLLLVEDSNIFRVQGLGLVFKVEGLGFRVHVL